ncbi:PmoA family protein [Opitutales bacterium]|nr:PmoA family protein [Opitutales bacterium]
MKKALSLLLFLNCIFFATASSYTIENIAFPDDMPPEVGGLAFDKNGYLYACLRRGDVVVTKPGKDPKSTKWKVFATGLHNPMGMILVGPGHLLVSQMAELTEIIDTDKDGVADRYNNLSTDFGISGNYHETNAICRDGDGGYYIALGTASHNGPTFVSPRGDYSKDGRRGRNFSSNKLRGWVVHYDKKGKLHPFASGFRMHNGITQSPDGEIWCGDNQGDWRGGSPIYNVKNGSFNGHPSSLVWDPDLKEFGTPIFLPRKMLDDLHNQPSVQLVRKAMSSCGEPFFIGSEEFGPFKGQILVPDENGRRINRLMMEKVDSAWQGASALFLNTKELRAGGVRIAMDESGESIYYASTARGWQRPDEGIQRITYNGKMPFHIKDFKLTTDGFKFWFTKPLKDSKELAKNINVRSFRFEYGYRYGSGEKDQKKHKILKHKGNGPFEISIDGLEAGRIYEIKFEPQIRSNSGEEIENPTIHYTLNRLKRPSAKLPATLRQSKDGFEIKIGGDFFARYHFEKLAQPIIWPVHGPGNIRMLRDYPMKMDTAGEAKDHPHHRAIFIGHQKMSGAGFWHNQFKDSGSVKHIKVIETRSGHDRALIKTLNAWRNKEGKTIGGDTRTMTFGGDEIARYLDLEINMHATNMDLVFTEFKDGFVGIRTHPDLRLTASPKNGVNKVFGRALNSEGTEGKKIWGKRADWVHYFGMIEGKEAGIAFFSHPSNLTRKGEKSWWHARDYGLISANPFAPEKIGGDGEHIVKKGQSLKLRYRLIFHRGSQKDVQIEKRFAEYAQDPGHPTSIMPGHPGFPEDYLSKKSK